MFLKHGAIFVYGIFIGIVGQELRFRWNRNHTDPDNFWKNERRELREKDESD